MDAKKKKNSCDIQISLVISFQLFKKEEIKRIMNHLKASGYFP